MDQPGETDPPVLTRDSLDEISALCARGLADSPARAELSDALFADEQPAIVRGDTRRGVVASVAGDGGSFVRLLVVDPEGRRGGYGGVLLNAAEDDAHGRGHNQLTIGADAPFFLWPGVPATSTDLICFLEHRHYSRIEINFDMTVDLASASEAPPGPRLATRDDRTEVDRWLTAHWPNWRLEALRALDKGNLFVDHDPQGISAFCAFEVNRRGYLGPVAVRPDLMGQGAGRAALQAALHELRGRGRDRIDVVWVGPVAPYARVGGRVSNIYFVYRKQWP